MNKSFYYGIGFGILFASAWLVIMFFPQFSGQEIFLDSELLRKGTMQTALGATILIVLVFSTSPGNILGVMNRRKIHDFFFSLRYYILYNISKIKRHS